MAGGMATPARCPRPYCGGRFFRDAGGELVCLLCARPPEPPRAWEPKRHVRVRAAKTRWARARAEAKVAGNLSTGLPADCSRPGGQSPLREGQPCA
jgi:hypothetical protein